LSFVRHVLLLSDTNHCYCQPCRSSWNSLPIFCRKLYDLLVLAVILWHYFLPY